MLDPSRISYQWTLRQIGAHLDERVACRMTLIEVPEGFILRHYPSFASSEPEMKHFARQDLISRDVEQERVRLQLQAQGASLASVRLPPPQKPGGYQDFLRALGFELDQTSVYYIALDEVGQNLVVTYLYVDARYNLTPQKKMVFLKPEDKQKILQAAYARRQKPVQPQPPVQSATRFFQ